MNKRILSLLLACVLCAGTMPAAVSAEEAERILLPGELISEAAVPEEEQAARVYYAGEETPAEDGAVTFHPYVFEIEGSEVRASVQLEPGLMGSGKDVSESTPVTEPTSGAPDLQFAAMINSTAVHTKHILGNPNSNCFEVYAFTTNATLAEGASGKVIGGLTVYERAIMTTTTDMQNVSLMNVTVSGGMQQIVEITTNLFFTHGQKEAQAGEILYIGVQEEVSGTLGPYSNLIKVTMDGAGETTIPVRDAPNLTGGTVGRNSEFIVNYRSAYNDTEIKQVVDSVITTFYTPDAAEASPGSSAVTFNGTSVYPFDKCISSVNSSRVSPLTLGENTYVSVEDYLTKEPKAGQVLYVRVEEYRKDGKSGGQSNIYRLVVQGGEMLTDEELAAAAPKNLQVAQLNATTALVNLSLGWTGNDAVDSYNLVTYLNINGTKVKLDAGPHTLAPAGPGVAANAAYKNNNGTCSYEPLTLKVLPEGTEQFMGYESDGTPYGALYVKEGDILGVRLAGIIGRTGQSTPEVIKEIEIRVGASTKNKTTITAKDATVKAGTDATYTVSLNDSNGAAVNNANLTLSIVDKTYDAVTGSDGKAQFSIGKRDAGTYEAKVEFKGNDLYEPCNATATITAEKTQASISASDATFKAGQAVTFNATLTEAGGSAVSGAGLSLTIAGSDTAVNANTNENGVALFSLGELPAGVHQVTVSFAENNLYLPCNKTASITVVKTATSISATDASFIAGQTINYTATLNNADGNAVSGTELTLIIADSSTAVKATTSENGVALFSLGLLPAGIHTVTISFEGNNLYSPCNATANINVTTAPVQTVITAQNAAFTAGQEINYTVTLTDSSGHAIHNAGLNLTMVENSLTRNAATDENGIATFGLGALDAGIYQTIISFSGDGQYLPCNATVSIEVGKAETTITATDTSFFADEQSYQYDATLEDSGKNAICNASLVLTVNGQQYTAITNDEGVASFRIKKLKVGSYQIEIKYEGDSQYLASSKSFKINIVKGSTKILARKKSFKVKVKNKKYTITLKDRNGKPIKGKKVTLKIKGKTYTAKTNSKGKATFNIKKLNKKGKYTATIRFKGDSIYNSCSKKVKITIK